MRLTFLPVAALLLASCYYESSHPIGNAERAELDQALIGTWRDPDGESDDVFRVRPFDKHTYLVEMESPGERSLLRAFVGELGGARFLNVREIDKPDAPFLIFRYHWSGDTLIVRGIKEHAPPPAANQALLQRWVSERLDNAEIYGEPARLVRD